MECSFLHYLFYLKNIEYLLPLRRRIYIPPKSEIEEGKKTRQQLNRVVVPCSAVY